MVRNFAYLSLYMPSSLDEKQCRCRLPVCRSPRSLFGHWSPDLRSWDFWKFCRQISPTKPYPTYPSMYIDRTHSLRYRWCIILKYQELSWVYITNCWMLFLSNELCSTGSMLLWRYVHSCRIWDFFQCIERFVLQWGHLLKTPSIKVLVDMVTWEADFDVNVGLLGSIMVVWSEFAERSKMKIALESRISKQPNPAPSSEQLELAHLPWRQPMSNGKCKCFHNQARQATLKVVQYGLATVPELWASSSWFSHRYDSVVMINIPSYVCIFKCW